MHWTTTARGAATWPTNPASSVPSTSTHRCTAPCRVLARWLMMRCEHREKLVCRLDRSSSGGRRPCNAEPRFSRNFKCLIARRDIIGAARIYIRYRHRTEFAAARWGTHTVEKVSACTLELLRTLACEAPVLLSINAAGCSGYNFQVSRARPASRPRNFTVGSSVS
jgi:hypothetical protein